MMKYITNNASGESGQKLNQTGIPLFKRYWSEFNEMAVEKYPGLHGKAIAFHFTTADGKVVKGYEDFIRAYGKYIQAQQDIAAAAEKAANKNFDI